MEERHTALQATDNEKKRIIELYALRICILYEQTDNEIARVLNQYKQNFISRGKSRERIYCIFQKMSHALSKLLIEQFYNTGEEDFFDRAMKFDENIELEDMSIISGLSENNFEHVNSTGDGVLVPYQGMFVYFPGSDAPVSAKKITVIVRDHEIVEQINKKLARGRQILTIDEFTLGKKYFDGLCMRTHYH